MRKNNRIKTLPQLQKELAFLKANFTQQGLQLTEDAKGYVDKFSVLTFVKKLATPSKLIDFDEKTNITGKLMSMVLPLLINKTIFRNAGMITKALTALGANRLGQTINAETISGLVNGVKSFFSKKEKKKEQIQSPRFKDYGIPPDSETY